MKQMSFCEEDCEISSTSARSSAVVEKVRPTTSVTPTIPGPPTLISATSRIAVNALTPPPILSLSPLSSCPLFRAQSCCESVPACPVTRPACRFSDDNLTRQRALTRQIHRKKNRENNDKTAQSTEDMV